MRCYFMERKYKIKCKLCGDILESKIPVKGEIVCTCGNVKLYSDYIAYNCNHLDLTKEECYEDLDTNKYSYQELKDYYNKVENNLSNKIQCKYCKDIIESKECYDLKRCSCGKVAVDGGAEYMRIIGNKDDYIDLSTVNEKD